MPRRQHSPTGGQPNFYISNCGDLRSFQPFSDDWNAFVFGQARRFCRAESAVENGLSKAGLMLFMQQSLVSPSNSNEFWRPHLSALYCFTTATRKITPFTFGGVTL